jgi:hypothetical protein
MNFQKQEELGKKWQHWVYAEVFFGGTTYFHDGRTIPYERNTSVDYLAEEVERLFHVSNSVNECQLIVKIQQMAKADREKVYQGATEREVFMARGLPETELELLANTFVFDMYS